MRLDIPGIRPALFSDERDVRRVREILRFRHRIRNLYGEDLDPEKTAAVQLTLESFAAGFPAVHRSFVDKLRQVADAL